MAELNVAKQRNKPLTVNVALLPETPYQMEEARSFSAGQIIWRKELAKLGLKKVVEDIATRHAFKYDLRQIIEHLVTACILEPCSKIAAYDYAKEHFLEPPAYNSHDVYRALSVIAKEADFIQESLFKNSAKEVKRDTAVLFYDCTNFYFELSEADDLRKYGCSKEHRPNPIVQLGLFADGSGIPLGFDIFPGNQNEQPSLKPLEQLIIKDFELKQAKMIICTDAGLASTANSKLNSTMHRDFITIQPINKTAEKEQEWILSPGRSMKNEPLRQDENPDKVKSELLNNNWRADGVPAQVYLSLDDIDEDVPENFNKIFFKEKYLVEPKTGF